MCHMSRVRCQMSLLNPYQTVRAKNLQLSHYIYFTLWLQCHMSGVTYQGSHVSCHMSIVTCQLRPFNDWTAACAAVQWLNSCGRGRSMIERLRPWTNDRRGNWSCHRCWPMRGLKKTGMERGHTDIRTSRILERLGPVGRFVENQKN